jgi:hypothetical protein
MNAAAQIIDLPPPEAVEAQIASLEGELRAMRRLLRASRAAAKAAELRQRREALPALKKGGASRGH